MSHIITLRRVRLRLRIAAQSVAVAGRPLRSTSREFTIPAAGAGVGQSLFAAAGQDAIRPDGLGRVRL
jgi:hypothetical protein